MKTLKFNHETAKLIEEGQKISTWRMFDDKDLSVNDEIRIIDKVEDSNPQTWKIIGTAKITEIVEKRLEDITEENIHDDNAYASKRDMLEVYRGYYGSKVTGSTPVKIIYFDFEKSKPTTPAEVAALDVAKLYTDGGSRGNPGPSAAAFVICNLDDSVVEKSGIYLGVTTNNKAEYQGLRLGLERARELGVEDVRVFMDSQLVINQVNGAYKVKNPDLLPAYQEVIALSKLFNKTVFTYVPRELNKLADKEVNRILDEQK
ncbi:MAG TPA: reverse transcriptase-like protein [Candidatus Saccharimonadales bacterium]|nr:reverse transcriptase-like protein [Candidatus Saccharimonadales bacterium]